MKSAADDLQNVTLSLPRQTLREARKMAVDRDTSLSRLLTDLIEEMVAAEDRYRQAQERHLALLDSARDLGTQGRLVSREDLHQRLQTTVRDAMILTSARQMACACVWTEDLNAGQSYDGVVIRNPFAG